MALCAGSLLAACLISAAGGAGNGVFWVAMISLVQKLTAHDYQARVVGLLESITAAAPGLGFALGGVITEVASPRASFLFAGIGGVTVVLVAAASLWKVSWAEDRASSAEPQGQTPRVGAVDPSTAP